MWRVPSTVATWSASPGKASPKLAGHAVGPDGDADPVSMTRSVDPAPLPVSPTDAVAARLC
jgi:hypothetical protein